MADTNDTNGSQATPADQFRLESPSVPRPPVSGLKFTNNTKTDGSPLSQMVLFSGSHTCTAGQQDLFNLAESAR